MTKKVFSVFFLFFVFLIGFAQSDSKPATSKKVNYSAWPSLYYTPETRLAFGGVLVGLMRFGDSSSRKSNIQHYVSVTQNSQILIENAWQLFLANDKWLWQGRADIDRFPELFFGIGKKNLNCPPVAYQAGQLRVYNSLMRHIKKEAYFGPTLRLDGLSKPVFASNINPEKLTQAVGGTGFFALSYGLTFVLDNRDFALNASKGQYIEVNVSQGFFDNPAPFYSFSFDARKYIAFRKSTVFAFHAIHKLSSNNIPFRLMPSMGGPSVLRGYYAGELRDTKVWMLQAEWRQHVIGRFGIVCFAGTGNFNSNYNELLSRMHKQVGIGLRCKLKKNENLNVRLDFAHTGSKSNVYLVLAESF